MVKVIRADSATNQISLSFTQVEDNSQALAAEALAVKRQRIAALSIGETMSGTVKVLLHPRSSSNQGENRCYAAIVSLPDGVEALLHCSDCLDVDGQVVEDVRDLFQTGCLIEVTVKAVDLEKGRVELRYNYN
jgi:ribosomal protein S1